MNEYQQEQVLSFCEMCGCDFDIATDYLRCCDWSIDMAVSMFFENGGAPLASHQQETIAENTTNEDAIVEDVVIPSVCEHCNGNINKLTPSTLIYKEECVYCFDNWMDNKGIDVCLNCYLGFCTGKHNHSKYHTEKTNHCLFLRILRKELPSSIAPRESKITKLAIGVEGGYSDSEHEPEYTTTMSIYCSRCNKEYPCEGYFQELGNKIILSLSGETKKEICQWEDENLKPCPHCNNYVLPSPCPQVSIQNMKCKDCELTSNLWLCLQCGEFHCGRKQWDIGGLPGNGHAIDHFKKTGHSLVVKLASLQDNHADVHCYECDDKSEYNYGDVLFKPIQSVLTQFGLIHNGHVIGLTADKQEKSLTEMNLFVNTDFDFSLHDEQGKEYKIHKHHHTCGLDNIGNSCYMNSILQVLAHLPSFIKILQKEGWFTHYETCTKKPTDCLICQFMKVINGILERTGDCSIKPLALKQVIGKLASSFASNQQQDCYEFLTVLLDNLQSQHVQDCFTIPLHYTMKCLLCSNRHQAPSDQMNCITVQIPSEQDQPAEGWSLQHLVDLTREGECIERDCENCHDKTVWGRFEEFEDFPEVLCIRVNRFVIDMTTYSIMKNTAPIVVNDELILHQTSDDGAEQNCTQKYKVRAACLHRGTKADCGHYVAVYKEDDSKEWILCNDSKVVEAPDAPISECYLVFYEKV